MKKIAKVIVLIGQSNAVGVGHQKYLKDHFSKEKVNEFLNGYKNVKINFYSHDFGSNRFQDTTVGLTEFSKKTVGPEVGIAESLTKDFNGETFYIVKYAIGGSNLFHDWLSPSSRNEEQQNETGEKKTGWCFDAFITLLKDSIKYLESQDLTPEIRAVCWMQGESDACIIDTVNNYMPRFNNMISDFEKEFKPYLKNYILADGGISQFWEFYKEMNELKKKNALSKERVKFIDTIGEGLSTLREPIEEPDKPHYDVDSIIKLGNFFEEAIKENLK